MGQVGLDVPAEDVDKLFDTWDPDQSGELELDEVHKQLRQHVQLNPALLPGAAGEIMAEAKNKIALRKERVDTEKATRLQGLDIDEGSGKSVAEQIRDALAKNFLRVIDLFHEWDDDGSGTVSREEFHRAMGQVGPISVTSTSIAASLPMRVIRRWL